MTEVLRVERATLLRGGNAVLAAVDWTVKEGERWVILGPNGAGKTSLLTLVAARTHPSEGAVWILGERLGSTAVQELGLRVGLSSDAVAARIPARELARDVVMTAAQGVTGRWREDYDLVDFERAAALMAAFGIQDFAGREYRTLSEGERKRVQLARALMTDPEILLLDEPFGALDEQNRLLLQQELLKIWEGMRKTAVFITHSIDEALCLGDRIMIMTAHPGTIKCILDNDLPRPRDISSIWGSTRYHLLFQEIWGILREEVLKVKEQELSCQGP